MIRDEKRGWLGCGFHRHKFGRQMDICNENGLDVWIYILGKKRIKRKITRLFDVDIDIEGKSLIEVTREAQEIFYG